MLNIKAKNIGTMASAADLIFEALRESIVDGDLQDGDLLRQDQLATMFNVSRIPVREALARLEEQGLVTNQRYKGAVVSSLSLAEIVETFEFRALLESEVIRHAVHNMRPASLAQAKEFHQKFAKEKDSANWAMLNRRFHETLYQDAGKPYFLQVAGAALDKVGRYLRAQLVLTDGMERARQEHEEILQSCQAKDADLAARLTHEHIMGACTRLVEFLKVQRN